MQRKVTLDQVKRELRARVCQHCPLRTPGKPGDRIDTSSPLDCEPACELFEHLPALTEFARQLDPMLRSVDEGVQRKIDDTIESIAKARRGYDPKSSPLDRNRNCVIATLTELVDQ
ncbi:MAG TPA: hypothetical protein VFB66_17140 [Tepidisphaeraceae bacterium]|nr:hypothetical protein [Tepidisphaeraceae bacterium]